MATPPDVAEAEPAAVQLTISGDQISVRNGLRALFDTFLVRRLAAAFNFEDTKISQIHGANGKRRRSAALHN